MATSPTDIPLLEVRNLETHLFTKRGVGRPVDSVSFTVNARETLGLVGESGSGKSLTALSVMRLNPKPASRIVGGEVLFCGEDLLRKTDSAMRRYRGGKMALILQDPMTALNPVYTVGNQIRETLRVHRGLRGARSRDVAVELLDRVRIPDPKVGLAAYPHQFSGGMRQRVVSAIALSGKPKLLIADEPTTALDVTVQALYLQLLKAIQTEDGLGILFVTHDFSVVARMCDRVAVMYAGKIVETAPTADLFAAPKHPYTEALLKSVPDVDRRTDRLYSISGQPPSVFAPPSGCAFANRCSYADARCHREMPPEIQVGPQNTVKCWRYVS